MVASSAPSQSAVPANTPPPPAASDMPAAGDEMEDDLPF